MQHKHSNLIQAWLNDNSVEFEFAYGSGVDFTWHDCDVNYLINNPNVQARLKSKPKKEKRWIGVDPSNQQQSTKLFKSKGDLWSYFGGCSGNASGYQFIEIEVEV